MGYNNTHTSFGFADLVICNNFPNNKSLETMKKLNSSLNWKRIESILLSHYLPGSKSEGASAYHPILLYKCLLLQKWYKIKSDPELETQINDRISFKRFLGLFLETQSLDHSTFSKDLESDWGIKNNKPHYGLKEHAPVNVNHGFILTMALTPESVNDTNYRPYCTLYSRHTKQPVKKVYADKGYTGKPTV